MYPNLTCKLFRQGRPLWCQGFSAVDGSDELCFSTQSLRIPLVCPFWNGKKTRTNPIGFGWDVYCRPSNFDGNFGKGPWRINHLGKFYHFRNFGRWNMEQGLWRILWPDSISLSYLRDGLLVDISRSLVHGDRNSPSWAYSSSKWPKWLINGGY